MCISPIRIKNPNYGLQDIGINKLKDCSSAFINIPCGHCSECVAIKQMGLIQRLRMESKYNYLFFGMLSYNSESLPIYEVNGYKIPYADFKDIQNMHKRIRKYNAFERPFRYFIVSEFGGRKGRPHFHPIYLIPKYENDTFEDIQNLESVLYKNLLAYWCRNVGSRKNPIYKPLLTYHENFRNGRYHYNFDLHFVNPALSVNGESDAGFYVLKYLFKPSERAINLQRALKLNLPSDEYHKVWNKVKPHYIKSLGFGFDEKPFFLGGSVHSQSVIDELRENHLLFRDSFPYPVYVNPDGSTWPLSRYYKNCGLIYNSDDALYLFNKKNSPDGFYLDDKSFSEKLVKIQKFENQQSLIDLHQSDEN